MNEISYTVRRSDRARRIRVTVDASRGVEVVLPRRAAEREAAAAVTELRPWITRRLAEVDSQRAAVAARGNTVPYLGQTLTLQPQPGRTRAHRDGDALLVPAEPDAQRLAIERWYRRTARDEIARRLEVIGARYTQLTIRGQKTRWGSCTRAGALSFNWRLLLAPEAVLDYVIWHEVCHLEVMDHSPRYWALVASRCPGYREQLRWLRHHGGTLVL